MGMLPGDLSPDLGGGEEIALAFPPLHDERQERDAVQESTEIEVQGNGRFFQRDHVGEEDR